MEESTMSAPRIGDRISLNYGAEITVKNRIGDGGQGIVYLVEKSDGQQYALKWYKKSYLNGLDKKHEEGKKFFKTNLITIIDKKAPNEKFLWPEELTEEINGCFGYIMKLRPNEYKDFSDILVSSDKNGNPVVFKRFRAVVESALNIVYGFRTLHAKGFFYLDLNDGNFFINTNSGDVLICDNDNVSAKPKYNLGKPGYIAPELVRGEAGVMSTALTDYHSLAVVLFKLFIRHDPFMGAKYHGSVMVTAEKERDLYGNNPVFIFDPNDKNNRPVLNVDPNPIKFWPIYPQYIKDAFIRTFCDGIKTPTRRLADIEWAKLILRLSDDIISCPCGTDIIWSDYTNPPICPKCKTNLGNPHYIELDNFRINLFPGNKIFTTHLDDDFENRKVYATVVVNAKNPSVKGLKNMSNDIWNVKKPTGESIIIQKDGILAILTDTEIEFPENKRIVIKN